MVFSGASNDTIAAIATAPGEAGIAIIRISGPKSLDVADRLFRCSDNQGDNRQCRHGVIEDDGRVVDEVILLVMRAPHSYTREDVVEIQCHGGRISAGRILRAVLKNGARLAEPGEFTCRAFLNGRIDLLQAESVLDLIRSHSERAAMAAIEQLEGRLSCLLKDIYDNLLTINAALEATLDFTEDELSHTILDDIPVRLEVIMQKIKDLLSTWEEGRLLRDGALVVISGRPNVGKSTLLNALLGIERAIVSPIPGTTRDTIEEGFVLDGIPIRLVDTAGLRKSACLIEQEGVNRARRQIEKADIVMYMIDQSIPVTDDDRQYLDKVDPRQTIVIVNKTDLTDKTHYVVADELKPIRCSIIKGIGLDTIKQEIAARLGHTGTISPHAAISERHRQQLVYATNRLDESKRLLTDNRADQIVLVSSCISDAVKAIGRITGREYSDDLLKSIFSRFCIGK